MTAIRQRRIDVGGVRLHVAEAGSGPLVVLLHGFPEFWYAWRHQLAGLAGDCHAVAPDTRGIGGSDRPAGLAAYRIERLVEDVAGLIAALGQRRAVLVGHDWGGFIAWETAIRHPELVQRLAIVNCAHPGIFQQLCQAGGAQAAASRYMLAFRSARGEELLERDDFAGFRANILAPGLAAGHLTAADAAAYLEAWRMPGALTAGLNYYRANRTGPPSGDDAPPRALAQTIVRVPTLVLWGERDPYFVPENLERLPEVVPDLTVRRFPDCDHWLVHQRPAETTRMIRAFVRGETP